MMNTKRTSAILKAAIKNISFEQYYEEKQGIKVISRFLDVSALPLCKVKTIAEELHLELIITKEGKALLRICDIEIICSHQSEEVKQHDRTKPKHERLDRTGRKRDGNDRTKHF